MRCSVLNGTALIDFKQRREKRTKGVQDEQKGSCQFACTVLTLKVNTRLRERELAPAARGSQDAGSRNPVFAF